MTLAIPKIKRRSEKIGQLLGAINSLKLSENELHELIDNLNEKYITEY